MRPTVEKFLHWLDVSCPDFIWFAPPCTIWSSLQELSMSPTRAGRGRQEAVMADREYQEVTSLKIWSDVAIKNRSRKTSRSRHRTAQGGKVMEDQDPLYSGWLRLRPGLRTNASTASHFPMNTELSSTSRRAFV
jgi:hypothetical protein